MLSYDFCEFFNNIYFLITPQNQAKLQRKQVSKVTLTEVVVGMFIGILQNIFRSLAIIFLKVQRSYFGRIALFL